jgi:hypothetical protein
MSDESTRPPSLSRLALFLAFFTFAGPLLFIFGPPLLNRLERLLGIQAEAPERPLGVPASALPVQRDSDQWMWAACDDKGEHRYSCRLFGHDGRIDAAASFVAHVGSYRVGNSSRPGRLPNPGEAIAYSWYYEDLGEIGLQSPLGCTLLAEGWLYYPARGTKAQVIAPRQLDREVAMSAEERTAFPADPPR